MNRKQTVDFALWSAGVPPARGCVRDARAPADVTLGNPRQAPRAVTDSIDSGADQSEHRDI